MLDPFILIAWFAAVGIALMSAPLGCFVAWQRLVYVGDSIAHAALLGVAIALLLHSTPLLGILGMAILIALLVACLQHEFLLPADSLLGILAHGSLALGLVIISQSPSISTDISGLLFGDVLAASQKDLLLIFSTAASLIAIMILRWRAFMRFILHPDIAAVEGLNLRNTRLLLMLMIAVMVALSIKLVGILLITSLLILPAATARLLATSPQRMAVYSSMLSICAVSLGFLLSLHYDTPTGPTIILSSLLLFLMTLAIKYRL